MKNIFKKVNIKFLPIIILILYLITPLLLGEYYIYVFTIMSIMIIVVQGLNVMIGFCGLFSFAQAGFMAFGAYFGSILVTKLPWMPFPLVILIVGIASASLGVLVGFPCLRLSGFYLAMATFGFSAVIFELIEYFSSLTGGSEGMYVPSAVIGNLKIHSIMGIFYLVAVIMVITQIAVQHIAKTKTGRAWNAIRDDEIAASSMGIDIQNYKLRAFAFGTFYAGIGGILYAYLLKFLNVNFFSGEMGLSFFLILVVGGIGTIYGPVLGSIFITLLPQILGGAFSQHMSLVYGVILVSFILLAPQGFCGIWSQLILRTKSNDNLLGTLFNLFILNKKGREKYE